MKIESKHPMAKDYSFKERVKKMKFHMENVKNGREAALQGSLVMLLWFIAPFSSDKTNVRFCPPLPRFPHILKCHGSRQGNAEAESHLYHRVL